MIEPMGRLSMFPFATVSLSIHFRAHPSLPPSPPRPSLTRAKFIASGEKFRGIQSADIVVTVRRMRENKDKPEEEAEEEEASQFKFTPQTLSSAAKCAGNEECILAGFRPYFFE